MTTQLPRDRTAPRQARAAVRAFAEDHGLSPALRGDLEISVTELVSNAVLHGDGDIRMALTLQDGSVCGEVVDQGRGFESEIRRRGIDEVGGRGLPMVAALASRWGVHEGSSHVWFAFDDAPEDDPEATAPELGADARPGEL